MDRDLFQQLTGNPPFPWQERLYSVWAADPEFCPNAFTLPTGTGKTSLIVIWLMLLAEYPQSIPRRLVYVVNRRTVVDQTTEEVKKLIENLRGTPLEAKLRELCVIDLPNGESPLAASSLRGQLADNRAWSADPCRPAVIVGTVDMIGSRLLFSGYRVGFKSRPLHAAFLAQNSLLLHDEAHLEPAFQTLVEGIVTEQTSENTRGVKPARVLKIAALSATSRKSAGTSFGLEAEDFLNPVLAQRVRAPKHLSFHPVADEKELPARLAELALAHKDSGQPILVFGRKLDHLMKLKDAMLKENKELKDRMRTLTGAMRGYERDALVEHPVFQRFLPGAPVEPGETVYLLCTSAGEVGVNISGKHLVCDLTTFESMAQRFGRVNRFGDPLPLPEEEQTRIDIVHPKIQPDKIREPQRKLYEEACQRTLAILQSLPDASPASLAEIPAPTREAAFSPPPVILPLTDILLDNWSLTSIREPLSGRPPVEPYLHGVDEEFNPPTTVIAWRTEVELTPEVLALHPPDTLLEVFPLKPHELLSDRSDRVFGELGKIAKRVPKLEKTSAVETRVWLVDDYGKVKIENLDEILKDKSHIENLTILLHPSLGGLGNDGMLDSDSKNTPDVACEWLDENNKPRRYRNKGPLPDESFRCVAKINIAPDPESIPEADAGEALVWHWYEVVWGGDGENGTAARHEEVLLEDHTGKVEAFAEAFARKLGLEEELVRVLKLAGRWHDLGKNRDQWQLSIGNTNRQPRLAKPGRRMKPVRLSDYRHEFGSLLDLTQEPDFQALTPDAQELIQHFIAAHHGRARPHFTQGESIDPDNGLALARTAREDVPHRFARLQQRFGRWGLAYLESILRAADYAASAERELHPHTS